MDSSKRTIDSSLLLLLPNNILPIDGSCYKITESSILQEFFFMSPNHVDHAMRNECRKNVKQQKKE